MKQPTLSEIGRLLEQQALVMNVVLERLALIEARVQAVSLGQYYSFQLGSEPLSLEDLQLVSQAMKKKQREAASEIAKAVEHQLKYEKAHPTPPPSFGHN